MQAGAVGHIGEASGKRLLSTDNGEDVAVGRREAVDQANGQTAVECERALSVLLSLS